MNHVLTISRPFDGLHRTALRFGQRSRALMHDHPRESVGLGVLGFVLAVAVGSMTIPNPATNPAAHAAPPAPPPMTYERVAPAQAVQVNAEIPLASGPNPAAAPFSFRGNADARAQALNCLATAVYYEAGNQDSDGERAVAQVVLNRV